MPTTISKEEHRLQFRFWLDVMRPAEEKLAEYVEELKHKRSFAQTIRDALNLIRDLRDGKLEWLLFLFPWVYQAIYAQAEADLVSRQQPDPAKAWMESQFARLEAKMEAIGALPISAGQRPSQAPIPKALSPGRSMDDDLALDIQKAQFDPHTNNPTFNFLISTTALTGDFANLPDEVLEYGIRIGRIPAHYAPHPSPAPSQSKPRKKWQKGFQAPAKPSEHTGTGNAKRMEVPLLAAPAFDDDLDEDIGLFG